MLRSWPDDDDISSEVIRERFMTNVEQSQKQAKMLNFQRFDLTSQLDGNKTISPLANPMDTVHGELMIVIRTVSICGGCQALRAMVRVTLPPCQRTRKD